MDWVVVITKQVVKLVETIGKSAAVSIPFVMVYEAVLKKVVSGYLHSFL